MSEELDAARRRLGDIRQRLANLRRVQAAQERLPHEQPAIDAVRRRSR